MKLPDSLFVTRAPAAGFLIRLMTGGIFFIEGLLKFLAAADLGAGRFAKIGLPAPEFFGPFVGGVEIVGGLLILAGLGVRLAVVPLLGVMAVAFVSVKIPILLGHGFAGFALRPLPRYGFLSMMHEARNDLCMIAGLTYLLIVGAGPWSADARIARGRGLSS
jgi:putative oxidoreductase